MIPCYKQLLFILAIAASITSNAQNCDCLKTKQVSLLDLKFQAGPKPGDGEHKALREHKMIEEIGRRINFPIEAKTVEFSMNNDIIQMEEMVLNISSSGSPSPSFSSGTCIDFFDQRGSGVVVGPQGITEYYTTGTIRKSGSEYLIHYELKASCSEKTVHAIDLSFTPPSLPDDEAERTTAANEFSVLIAKQLVEKFGSFGEKIQTFELKEKRNPGVVIEPARVKLSSPRKVVASGETIEVELVAIQCDGSPLKNIEFVLSTQGGGTKGGTAAPAKVTTDENGKAKFKFTKDNTPTAVIVAKADLKTPSGCPTLVMGHLGLGNMMKVTVHYNQKTSSDINVHMNNAVAGNFRIGNASTSDMTYETVLYYQPLKKADPKNLSEAGTLIEVPAIPNANSRVHYLKEDGTFFYTYVNQESGIVGNSIINFNVKELNPDGNVNENKFYFLSHPKGRHSVIRLIWKPDFKQFFIEFNYKTDDKDKMFPESTAYVFADSDGAKFIKRQITDAASPYKTEYIINAKMENALGGVKVAQTFFVQVLSPYDH